MRINRPLTVLTALAVGTSGLLVVGLGSFLDISTAAEPRISTAAAQRVDVPITSVIKGYVEDGAGELVDNYQVQATAVGASTPAASAISYGGLFKLHVPAGTYRITGGDLDEPARYAPYSHPKLVTVLADETVGLGALDVYLPAPVAIKAPSITGTVKVGLPLRANPGEWDRDDIDFEYVWLRGGTEVGDSRNYRPTFADAGKRLTVRVEAWTADAETGVATSAAVAVPKVVLRVVGTVRNKSVVLKIRVTGATGLPIVVKEGNRTLARRTASSTVTLPRVTRGKHTYLVGPAAGSARDFEKVTVRVR